MKRWLLLLLLLLAWPWNARCQQAAIPIQGSAAAGDTGSHVFSTYLFKGVTVTWNAGTVARYLMVFDGTATPSNGSTTSCVTAQATGCLAYCQYVPSSTSAPAFFSLDFNDHPFPLRNGMVAALSTGAGCGTFTKDTGTDWFYAQ